MCTLNGVAVHDDQLDVGDVLILTLNVVLISDVVAAAVHAVVADHDALCANLSDELLQSLRCLL